VNSVIVLAGSIQYLRNLRRLCGDRFLLLMPGRGPQDTLVAHASETGGTAFVTADSFGAFCLLSGVDLRETSLAFRDAFEGFNPLDFEALVSRDNITLREYLAQCDSAITIPSSHAVTWIR
jgi:hypothetical protein